LKTGPVEFPFSKTFEVVLGLRQLPIQLVLRVFAPSAGGTAGAWILPLYCLQYRG